MHIVLGDVPNCDAYLNDIVIYSETWEDHLKTLKMVFERLESASLTLNLTKCEIGKATITYLGKKVGEACGCLWMPKWKPSYIFQNPTTSVSFDGSLEWLATTGGSVGIFPL